jgi:hypothetical protein
MNALRICCAVLATPLMTSAMIGRVSDVTHELGGESGAMVDTASNQPKVRAKYQTRKTPMMKPGTALPMTARIWTSRSIQPRLTAAATPRMVARIAVSTIAMTTMTRVTGSRLAIAEKTGSLVNQDSPNSPRTALSSQSARRLTSGWSKPSSAALRATSASEAWSPMMLRAMLPLPENSRTKVRHATVKSTATPERSRRRMKDPIISSVAVVCGGHRGRDHTRPR